VPIEGVMSWFQLPTSEPTFARECPTAAVRKFFIAARQQLGHRRRTIATLVHRLAFVLHAAGKIQMVTTLSAGSVLLMMLS
jgi:hypothetical protein